MANITDIKYETLPQPRSLRLDTTTTCNAKCPSCHRFLSTRKGEMSLDMILKILHDVERWEKPLDEIVPVNYGEFLAREDWFKILQLINSRLPKTQIVLPTNGSMLNEEVIKNLCSISTLKIINFSINAFFDETYESFMGFTAGTLRKIESAIEIFRVARPDIMLWVSMVFDPQYQSDLDRDYFVEYWRQKNVIVWILAATSCDRTGEIRIPRREPCRSLYSDIVIGYDSKLSSCCFDSRFKLDLGEYTGDLKADWNNPKLTEIRKIHSEYKRSSVELCSKCSYA